MVQLQLNKQQLGAVRHRKGPLLIIAGAGTGKTTVITERIKYLISRKLAKPSEILALTFTEKAAVEMETRVDQAMPYGYTQMWILTFHGFCDRILRDEAFNIGLDTKYKLLTQAEATQIVRDSLFDFDLVYFRPLGNPTRFVSGMLAHFSRLQDEDINPNDYLTWVNSKFQNLNSKVSEEQKADMEKWLELARAYQKYDEIKTAKGYMDFGDLIVKTLKLFRQRPNILKQYQTKFKYLLVDEFQDTNISQYELIKLLAPPGKNPNLSVVGDDSQSIYKFRGAAISNIMQFRDDYKDAKTVVLTQNYRSTQAILDSAYRLITHNNPDTLEAKLGIDKNLISVTSPKSGDPIKFFHKDRVENEAEEVAEEIERLVEDSQYPVAYGDIAILVRANNHAEPFIRALARHGIPYQFLGPGRLFRQPEIVDLISYLRILANLEDSVSLYRVLSIDYFGISATDLAKIGSFSRRKNISLFEACRSVKEIFVSNETKRKVRRVIKIIQSHLKLINRETAGQILYYFLENSGLIQKLLNPDSPEAEKRAANISKFFDKLKTYEVDRQDATVPAVVDWIELASELGESPLAADTDWSQNNAVNILTVHSSKGLEFGIVFLVNLVSQRFPSIHRKEQIPIPEDLIKETLPEGDYHLQEERRLFYVGMTRAMKRLYFSAADYYSDGQREKKLSPFIFEALGDKAVVSETDDKAKQLSFLDYSVKSKTQNTRYDIQKLHIDYLSYSQIDAFRLCPLHYKLRYILNVPTPPSAALSFGSSIHEALKDFYTLIKAGEKPSEKLILEQLSRNWINEGYKDRRHEKKMLERGEEMLKKFFKSDFDSKNLPIELEKPFVVPLEIVGQHIRPLKIGGKIDRIDILDRKAIEIIDYKTSQKIPTQAQIDNDLQMSIYALAASRIPELPFGKNPKDVICSFYYLEEGVKMSTVRNADQLKQAEVQIFDWREKIENSDFRCSGSILCQDCEFSLFCRSD